MSDDERPKEEVSYDDGKSEAKVRMEQEQKRRQEKAAEEWAEYEEIRKVEREKEAQEIQQLRERREKRKMERAEEEKRLSELRAQEDQKRRAEEEERQRRKREEESRKKEERERKQKESEERAKKTGRPNFTISKKAGGADVADDQEADPAKPQKTKEQLEAERKAVLEQRFHKVNTSGMGVDQLKEKAKELHNLLYHLESEKYDLQKRFEQQNYDMMELAERARQMNKGGTKNAKVNVAQTPDPFASKMSGIPPRVTMYSQYERVKDRRSFDERREVYVGPIYGQEYVRIEPTQKIIMTENGARAIEDSKENEAPENGGHH